MKKIKFRLKKGGFHSQNGLEDNLDVLAKNLRMPLAGYREYNEKTGESLVIIKVPEEKSIEYSNKISAFPFVYDVVEQVE